MANRSGSNTLRIVGGIYRSRQLRFPDVQGLRPTSDRVRETLFNWLQTDIRDARCLDLFAGSGALGFEALSRGGARVTLCDIDRTVVAQLRENAALLQLGERCDIQMQNGIDFLQQTAGQSFDLVFLDPPFADKLLAQSCTLLAAGNWLADHALVYLEQDSSHPWPTLPGGWQCLKEGKAGQAAYRLIRKGAIPA